MIHAVVSVCAASVVRAEVRVPTCPGLTIVTAVSQRDGDYESIKTIESVTPQGFGLKYSSEFIENAVIKKLTVRRTVLPADLANATLYMHHFNSKAAAAIPGTTAIGTSSAVLRALKTKGEAQLGIFESVAAAAPIDRKVSPNVYDYQMVETIRRVGSGPMLMPVTVNDARRELPAIHARGDYYGDKAEFFFLDDETNPIALKYRIGRDTLDVVKIRFNCALAPGRAQVGRLEQSLIQTGRADVYSIYFSFNSDQIREESEPTLEEIADVMRRHPDWRLSIEGHTDSVASDTYNLTLSQRRAAVREGGARFEEVSRRRAARHGRLWRVAAKRPQRHARRAGAQPARRARAAALKGLSVMQRLLVLVAVGCFWPCHVAAQVQPETHELRCRGGGPERPVKVIAIRGVPQKPETNPAVMVLTFVPGPYGAGAEGSGLSPARAPGSIVLSTNTSRARSGSRRLQIASSRHAGGRSGSSTWRRGNTIAIRASLGICGSY